MSEWWDGFAAGFLVAAGLYVAAEWCEGWARRLRQRHAEMRRAAARAEWGEDPDFSAKHEESR